MIQVLYDNGQKVFGENYFQELVEKSKLLPSDIQWHFIGHLQSSKASKILREVPNLDTIETVDSISLATKLNNACENINRETLNIYLQIKTSNEDSKSGIEGIENIIAVVDYILTNCSHLKLTGLMTIGAPGDSSCFDRLVSYKHALCTHNFENSKHEVLLSNLKLSMGMSGDFQEAIRHGAHIVRVGSSIFGNRIYSNANQ